MSNNVRHVWALACSRIAMIAAVFSLILGAWLVANSFQLYQGAGNGRLRLIEESRLLPLKAALREAPDDEALKQQIRQLDQELRHDYFRREKIANRGAWLLIGGAAVLFASLQLAALLKRPSFEIPKISKRPADPVKTSALAAKAVAGTALGLAGLATALVWGTGFQWQHHPKEAPMAEVPESAPSVAADAIDAAWFPSDEELAENWPRFRGHDGSGITQLTGFPDTWDAASERNVLWKTAIDLPGGNSPIVWGERVYLTGADEKRREIYCFEAASGTLLWKEPVGTPKSERAEAPEVMEETGFAAPTAVTDGRRVFAVFANGDVAGFTTDGKQLWVRSFGAPENPYGHATSLTMWRNRLIVIFDQGDAEAEESRIMALDAGTGGSVWTTQRAVTSSWASPILIKHDGREQIITTAEPWVIAYDPASGAELWKVRCMSGDVASSPVYANGLVYVASDHEHIVAIHPDGTGDVTESKIAWKQDEGGLPDTCSLFCDGPRLYTLVFGVLYAYDALTGKLLWEHDHNTHFLASPAMINGRIHLLSEKGVMIIGDADQQGFKQTGSAEIGEKAGASPAVSPERIYLRGEKHLFCIGTKNDH